MCENQWITIKEFVSLLWTRDQEASCRMSIGQGTSARCKSGREEMELLKFGHVDGWLTEQDVEDAEKYLERRHAARILHEFLRVIKKEKDEPSICEAMRLKDIYDCRVCVNHVAQVFCKGIMEEYDRDLFGMREPVSWDDAKCYVERTLTLQKRAGKCEDEQKKAQVKELLAKNKAKRLQELTKETLFDAQLIDVRTKAAYEKEHLLDAICIPMAELLENVELLGEEKEKRFIFYCDGGYQSEVAACCAAEAGYEKVYYFGRNEIGIS